MNSALFSFPPSKAPGQLSPLVLAYIGDAVYEMYIRQYVISQPNHRPHHLHREAVKYVSAKAQSKALQAWMPHLTEEEKDIVKRGRNAKSGTMPKNADVLEYRHSTAFECLIGYLYYKGKLERLQSLLEIALQARSEAAGSGERAAIPAGDALSPLTAAPPDASIGSEAARKPFENDQEESPNHG